MASGEFIEFLSDDALSELNKANAELVKMVQNVNAVGAAMKNAVTPSASEAAIKDLTEKYRQQEQVIQSLQKKIISLSETRQKSITKTREEVIENKVLTQQQDLLIKANSKLAGAYANLNAQRSMAAKRLKDLIASEKASTAEIKKAQKEFDVLDAKVRKANHAIGNFTGGVGKYRNVFSGFTNLLGAFGISTGVALFADLTRNIFQTTKEIQSLDLALRTVSDTQQQFASNQAFLNDIAEKYGIEIQGLTKNFTEFWVASADKLKESEIKDIFESISKAAGVLGLSVQKQDQAFLALQQMMSKGTVQAEELKRQLGDALPGAIKAATAAYQALHPEMKVTEQFFMEQMKAGKVLSAELLPELAKQFEKLYGIETINNVHTLAAETARFSNSWVNLVRTLTSSDSVLNSLFTNWFKGLTAIVDGLNRAASSWGDLQNQAEQTGKEEGMKAFNETIKSIADSEKKLAEANAIVANTRPQLAKTVAELNKINKELQDFEKQSVAGKILGVGRERFDRLQKRKEELEFEKGTYEGRIKAFKAFLVEKDRLETAPPTTKTEEQIKKEKKAYDALLDAQKKGLEALHNERIAKAQLAAEQSKTYYENENSFLLSDVNATKMAMQEKIKASEKLRDANIRIAKEEKAKKDALLGIEVKKSPGVDYKKQFNANKFELQKEEEKQAQDHFQRLGKDYKDWFAKQKDIFKEELDQIEKNEEAREEKRKEREEKEKEFAERMKKIADEMRAFQEGITDDFASQIGFSKTFAFLKLDEEGQNFFQRLEASALSSKEKFAVYFNAISEMGQEAFNALSNLAIDKSEKQIAQLEKERDLAISFAGDSAAAKEEIEREFEEKRKAIERRKFEAQKKLAIANIAIDAAQAIIGVWQDPGYPLAIPLTALIAGMAIAQTSAVTSQQYEGYWKGTDNAPEGWAKTDEHGAEIHTDSKGNIKDFGSDKGTRLKYLKKGDKILTAKRTKELLSFASFNDDLNSILFQNKILPSQFTNNGWDSGDFHNGIDKLATTINSKPSFTLVKDERGERIYREEQGRRTELLNNRLNVTTFNV